MNHPFGWDLPPGVRSCDIPGNRPEDAEAERFDGALFELLMRAHRNELTLDEMVTLVKANWPDAVKEEDELQAKEAKAEDEMYRQMAEDDAKAEEMYRRGEEQTFDHIPEDNDDPDRYPRED